jgi:hypothetical protein
VGQIGIEPQSFYFTLRFSNTQHHFSSWYDLRKHSHPTWSGHVFPNTSFTFLFSFKIFPHLVLFLFVLYVFPSFSLIKTTNRTHREKEKKRIDGPRRGIYRSNIVSWPRGNKDTLPLVYYFKWCFQRWLFFNNQKVQKRQPGDIAV